MQQIQIIGCIVDIRSKQEKLVKRILENIRAVLVEHSALSKKMEIQRQVVNLFHLRRS